MTSPSLIIAHHDLLFNLRGYVGIGSYPTNQWHDLRFMRQIAPVRIHSDDRLHEGIVGPPLDVDLETIRSSRNLSHFPRNGSNGG